MDLPTIIALIVIVGIVLAIIIKLIINKKQGKTSCSCGCGGCAMRDMCHSKRVDEIDKNIVDCSQKASNATD